MQIRLQSLGGLHAELDGAELSWLASKSHPSALLVYLAIERRATRDALQALLWPEGDANSAGHRLRNTVYELRRSLGDGIVESKGRELCAGAALEADALELERAIELGHNDRVIDLYRGPFLAGVHLVESAQFEAWIDGRRLKYARLFRRASRALVQEKLEAGNLRGALAVAHAWVAPDPLDDEAQHHLVELLLQCGERTEALTQYESYARLLQRDDLVPLEETRALIAAVERESPGLPVRMAVTNGAETQRGTDAPVSTVSGTTGGRRPRRRLLAAAILLAGLAAAAWKLTRPASAIDAERVAVLRLVNQTGVDSLDAFGALAALVVTDGLARTGQIRVAPTTSVMAARAGQDTNGAPDLTALARETGAGLIVQGAYFLNRDSLVVQPQIIDVGRNQVAFPVERVTAPASQEDRAIQLLLERVLITLSGRLDERLAGLARGAAVVDLPMSLEAYREFAVGLEKFWRFDVNISSLPHFERAVQLDSTSATALLWNAWSDWLQNANLPGVDSLLARVERNRSELSSYDLAILEWLRAWIDGDLEAARGASVHWAAIGGGVAHTEAAYDAFRLNRVDEAHRHIQDALAIPSNRQFTPTWQVADMVLHVRGDYEQALRSTREMSRVLGASFGRMLSARSYAALGRIDDVRAQLQAIHATNSTSFYFRDAAAELRWHGHADAADEIGRLAAGWYREALAAAGDDGPPRYARSRRYLTLRLAGTLFDLGAFDEAQSLYEALAAEPMPGGFTYDHYFAYDLEPLGYLGLDAARRGDRAAAEAYIQRIAAIDRPYLLGNDFHWQARIAAALGDCERTAELLEKALDNGSAYWQWGGFPLLREVPQFTPLKCPAMERFMAFR